MSRPAKEIRTLRDHIDAIYALEFTPDGKRLVTGAADRSVKIWDVATGRGSTRSRESTDGMNTIAISPDGKRVAAGGSTRPFASGGWATKKGTLENTLIAHEDAILKLAWSPDGKLLASASADRSIKLFRAADLTRSAPFPSCPTGRSGSSSLLPGTSSQRGFSMAILKFTTSLLGSAAVPALLTPAGNRTTPPTLNVVAPLGVARGTTVEMTVEGLNLARASAIYFSEPGVTGRSCA